MSEHHAAVLYTQVLRERDKLTRCQEIIADLAFHVGYHWQGIPEKTREALMEDTEGSRGLMQKVIEWASEFDVFWEALPEGDERRETYISEVDEFADKKLSALVATVRLEM